ncbi:MAG: hypothetical protein U9M92_01825 [Patescibacteria group bacterium]|nr:hypothetical protein [Patescibacteria group bacterium]
MANGWGLSVGQNLSVGLESEAQIEVKHFLRLLLEDIKPEYGFTD